MKQTDRAGGAVALMAEWSLDRLLWSPRTLAMGGMAFFPAALALLFQAISALGFDVPVSGFGFFSMVTATVGFQFIAPMLALFYASGILVDEIESGTIVYLITRPRSRASLLAGKMAGSFALEAMLFLPSLVLTFFLAVAPGGWQEVGRYFPALARDLGAALLGLAAYNGLFAAIGIAFRRPVLIGLIYVFGWQAVATYIPGLVGKLTVAYHLQSLLPHESFQGALSGFLGGREPALQAALILVLVSLATHGLAILLFARKQFPGGEL
jgi:ABC-type transport system involved in multi-copper enzyme maturation permease subunit